MTSLRDLLGDLLPEAADGSDGVTGPEAPGRVIVTVIANRSTLPVSSASRLIVREDASTVGTLHPELDPVLVSEALTRLESRKLGLASFRLTSDGPLPAGRETGDIDVFFEVLARAPRLIIVGAGHIALPLARIAKLLDFRVIIVDDRPELANPDRFPDADEIVIGEYRQTFAGLALDRDTFVVLVTRGHVHDQACLEEALPTEAAYIGMIGSKRRVRTVLAHALENGADLDRLRRVHAPIGLDINALTPAEIAVAIMAEIVNVRRGGNATSLALGDRFRV